MSRGGRGGHGGSGKYRIGGVDTPWDMDPAIKLDNKPEDLFPDYKPKPSAPPLRFESLAVARYRMLRSRIHEGPLYTVLGASVRVTKPGSKKVTIAPSKALFDPFETMPTFTQKFKKTRNRIPRLDTRPYVTDLFPKELWDVLGVEEDGTAAAEGKGRRKKKLQIARLNRLSRLEQLEANGELDDIEDEAEEEEEEPNEQEEKSREFGEEEVDEDDDEDDLDDYNAEQYFDTGEGDDYDDGGAGGEDYYE